MYDYNALMQSIERVNISGVALRYWFSTVSSDDVIVLARDSSVEFISLATLKWNKINWIYWREAIY